MRISNENISEIKTAFGKHFPDAKLYLFGSRVYDTSPFLSLILEDAVEL